MPEHCHFVLGELCRRNGDNLSIMTTYRLSPFDEPRETILIPLIPSTLDTLPWIVTATFSQEATEETEI